MEAHFDRIPAEKVYQIAAALGAKVIDERERRPWGTCQELTLHVDDANTGRLIVMHFWHCFPA